MLSHKWVCKLTHSPPGAAHADWWAPAGRATGAKLPGSLLGALASSAGSGGTTSFAPTSSAMLGPMRRRRALLLDTEGWATGAVDHAPGKPAESTMLLLGRWTRLARCILLWWLSRVPRSATVSLRLIRMPAGPLAVWPCCQACAVQAACPVKGQLSLACICTAQPGTMFLASRGTGRY